MDLGEAGQRIAELTRNLAKQQDLIIDLLCHKDATVRQIEQARQYARNMRDTKQRLKEFEEQLETKKQ
jgi:hypothetical protein